jgi:hypothetical protein
MSTLLVDAPAARAKIQQIADPVAAIGTMALTDANRQS